jgi:hypothetical protein
VNVLRLLRRHAHDRDVHVAVGRMAPLRRPFGTILDYIGNRNDLAALPGLRVGVKVSFGDRAGADYGDPMGSGIGPVVAQERARVNGVRR